MEGSILESLGEEIIRIICPVSICMLLVVVLVRKLRDEVTSAVLGSIAVLVYSEDSTDSVWTKLWGALLNAAVFIAIVTVVTFLLVLLFYFRCTKFLRFYMGFAAFTVLAYMGGTVAILLIQNLSIPIDAITAAILLYNFAIVGVLSVFFCRMPIFFTQGYLVVVGMLVAFWFASLPEWTTWVLLVAISLYDIVAVLTPGGPLNLLVKLAMTRDEEIPALIYEARPVTAPHLSSVQSMTSSQVMPQTLLQNSTAPSEGQRRIWKRRTIVSGESSSLFSRLTSGLSAPLLVREEEQVGGSESAWGIQRLQNRDRLQNLGSVEYDSRLAMRNMGPFATSPVQEEVFTEKMQVIVNRMVSEEELESREVVSGRELCNDDEGPPLIDSPSIRTVVIAMNGTEARSVIAEDQEISQETEDDLDEGMGLGASGAIKLGLGDFIFYSVLVGRAALYDMMTVYACYLAIITGLGATLALLAVCRRALPALPISIALGVMFYFLTRLLMEPFVVQSGTHLVFF